MKVSILGAGGISLGYAAFLTEHGHEPVIWSPSGAGTLAFANGDPLTAKGKASGSFKLQIGKTFQETIENAEVVIIALPGNGHRMVFDKLADHLQPDQTVIISSHSSLGALYLSKQLARRKIIVPIIGWGTTFLTSRRTGDREVSISNIRAKVDTATLPVSKNEQGLKICQKLFGDHFEQRSDILAISLSNLNPIAHLSNALCNLTRIERGEEWANYDCITGTVGRLYEALDVERLNLAKAYGLKVRTVFEHLHLSFHVPVGSVAEMSSRIHALRGGPPGPKTLDTRYVTEDIPYGLVPFVAIANCADVYLPIHESGVTIFSALYGRDFRRENNLLPDLGIDDMNAEDLHNVLRDGWKTDFER